MKTRIISIWYYISSSYWFIPSIMLLAALGLSILMVNLDQKALQSGWIESFNWLYANKPEGARSVLSTIAGSMITVAGVVFSITIVAFTLASTQFGPRLLGNFMRDKGNQFVLGTFISTFLYSLLILRTIRSGDENLFVPHLSINLGVLLSIVSLGVLIYYIHHTAESMRIHNIINLAFCELRDSIKCTFPDEKEYEDDNEKLWWMSQDINLEHNKKDSIPVFSSNTGYLRIINFESLMEISTNNNLVFELKYTPGDYIIENSLIAHVWNTDDLDEKTYCQIQNSFILGIERTTEQDIEFIIDELVEIALRAISPGVNDPFTAINCIDRLGAALCLIAERHMPPAYKSDENNNLRIILKTAEFKRYLDISFNQIINYGKSDIQVMKSILINLNQIMQRVNDEKDKELIVLHAEKILRASKNSIDEQSDINELEAEFNNIRESSTLL